MLLHRDLLQRHIQNTHHVRDYTDRMAHQVLPANGKGAIPIACQRCFQAKVKCDKEEPCDSCKKKGHTDCKKRYSKRNEKVKTKEGITKRRRSASVQQSPTTSQQYSMPQLQQERSTTINPALMDVEPQPPMMGASQDFGDYYLTSAAQQDYNTFDVQFPEMVENGQGYFPLDAVQSAMFSPVEVEFLTKVNGSTGGSGYEPASLGYPEGQISIPPWGGSLNAAMPLPTTVLGERLSEPLTQTTPTSTSSIIATRRTSLATSCDSNFVDSPYVVLRPQGHSTIHELQVVLDGDAAWSFISCTPRNYADSCPKTAEIHLRLLERFLQQPDAWRGSDEFAMKRHDDIVRLAPYAVPSSNSVVPLTDQTRDRLMCIMQQFLLGALDSLQIKTGQKLGGVGTPYLLLPPGPIVEEFLQSYVWGLSVYYPLVVGGCLDPNEMLSSPLSTLLLLLMIAQGAAAVPLPGARYLSTGLTVICRISVHDSIEVAPSADPVALRCALLATLLGAWSGDKWLMDMAMGQRNIYMSVRQPDSCHRSAFLCVLLY